MYEGEWVDDSPRCGEFRDPVDGEDTSFGDAAVYKHDFELPEVTLQNSRAVIDCTTAATRLECSVRRGVLESGIDESMLERAEKCFAELDTAENGAVQARFLGSVFSALGVFISPEDLGVVMGQFSMGDVDDLSFPEVVEIASFLLQNR